ncbi:hypothetical protein GCM10007216_05160 [Thalassobacillus devorans]|uniref:TetR family transcriptional regulator n=1 Tax=Thalassobacillus devorans TaxID=279813 RepID=A0ABQ1NHS3_9BACI|nr:hypothetical protein [Thalassobacillus devorans]NIK27423.1 hypothetical protein [Thalassobacillus devorans]GGC77589.1 hypothetical protein GCM10007216_05160 [Thalassobacillus devorans]
MEHRVSHQDMDELLKQLEDDYIKAVKDNDRATVERFIEKFLYDSWDYNEENIDSIKYVLKRYSNGEIAQGTFSGAFNEMVDHLQAKLERLDHEKEYAVLHTDKGASLLVAFVDGLVLQYYLDVYDVEQLKEMTPYLKQVILQALKTKGDENQ